MSIIKSENWDGVTAPALPAGWTVDSQLVTSTANGPTSAPNSLVYPAASINAAVVPYATWATVDTNGGNVQVSATARFASSTGQQYVWVFARCPAVASNALDGSTSYYAAIIQRGGSAPGFTLLKKISGANTTLGIVGASAFADATNYRIFLLCSGASLQARCQRLSDSFWLNSSGSFVSDPSNQTVAISVTDTSLSAASGYAGTAFFLNSGSGGAVGVDDWLLETPPGSISASPSHLVAGGGAQTVLLTGVATNFSTSSSTQFTLSGGVGASILSQSASSATAATLSINPGTASGSLVITDTTDGSITTTIAVSGTYYVAPTGSDANTGLDTAHPWQTIGHVNGLTLQPGDTILFQGGQSFTGNLVLQQSGTAAYPIVVSSYGTGQATISAGTGTGIQIKDADHVHLANLAISGPGVTVSGATSSTTSTGYGVEVLTTTTQPTLPFTTYRTGVRLDRLSVSGLHSGIYCYASGGSATGPYPVGLNGLQVTNCTVHDCLVCGIMTEASDFNPTGDVPYHKNAYIGGCTVYNIYGDSAVTAIWTGSGILFSKMQNGIIERCCVSNCGQANGSAGGGPVGLWFNESTGCIIQYCECSNQHDPKGIDGGAFDFDGGTQNCIVQYCYSHNNDGTAIIAGAYTGSHATQNNVFRYNISQNDGRAQQSCAYREFNAPSGTVLHNNVFYCSSVGGSGAMVQDSSGSFYNNIFWCGSGVTLLSRVSSGTFAGNLYWFGGGAFSLVYNGITYSSLAAFQGVQETTAAGGVPAGVSADPVLSAPGSGGTLLPTAQVSTLAAYALGGASPAIDAGLDLRVLFGIDPGPLDFSGHASRAGAGYDIGAMEYGAASLVAGGSGLRRIDLGGGIAG